MNWLSLQVVSISLHLRTVARHMPGKVVAVNELHWIEEDRMGGIGEGCMEWGGTCQIPTLFLGLIHLQVSTRTSSINMAELSHSASNYRSKLTYSSFCGYMAAAASSAANAEEGENYPLL